MKSIRLAFALVPAVLLSACATDRPVGLELPAYGNAVRANIAAQTVNPMAPMNRGPLVNDGERAAIQQDRYVTDTVETPMDVGTLQGLPSSGGGGGGSGGGGGGGSNAGGLGIGPNVGFGAPP